MEKDKSPLKFVSVSLDAQTSPGSAAAQQGEPWNILICADLGFASVQPKRVYASEWNEFMSQSKVRLSDAVAGCLGSGDKPTFIEYPVDSLRDFSAASVEERLSLLAPFHAAIAVVLDLLDGKIDGDKAGGLLGQTAIPLENKRSILALLGKKEVPAPRTPPTNKATGTSRLDSLLAAMDLPGGEPGGAAAAQPPGSPSEALFAAITQGSGTTLPRQQLMRECATLEDMVKRQVERIIKADFFSRANASWQSLKRVLGLVGRKKNITVTVFSRSSESLADTLPVALKGCYEQGLPPDIVLIDKEYSFSTADIAQLEAIAETAASRMCIAIASLDSHDALFDKADSRDTLKQFFEDLKFLPLKKLRTNPAARSLVLCGPAVMLDAGVDGQPLAANGGWQALSCWIEAFLSGRSPFECMPNPSSAAPPPSFAARVPLPIVKDAAAMGLTLFGSSPKTCGNTPIVTLIDEQVANPAYTSFAYNLAANRTAKLAALKVTMLRDNGTESMIEEEVRAFLIKQLATCDILIAAEEIALVENEEHALEVTINSAQTVGGFPLRIQFTL